jgi:hypothetical protein
MHTCLKISAAIPITNKMAHGATQLKRTLTGSIVESPTAEKKQKMTMKIVCVILYARLQILQNVDALKITRGRRIIVARLTQLSMTWSAKCGTRRRPTRTLALQRHTPTLICDLIIAETG